MAINVTTSKQQITASVAEDKISATVSGGFGATGPSGVINVTAPITNAGTTTAANVGLAVGTGLSVSGGSLVVTPDTYATLVGGKVPADQLPSYVDDVLEYANLASLPGTGESGKIYVALNTGKIYRWSGSAYFEISTQPGNTDAVPEGSTNLYFTNARARNSFGTGASGQVVRWDGSEWTAGTVPIASGSVVGGVRIGSGISIDGNGVISASAGYTLPQATNSTLGGITVSTGLSVASGALSVSYGTTSGTACQGDDSRLSDARTPTDGSVTTAKIADGAVTAAKIASGAVTSSKLASTLSLQNVQITGTFTAPSTGLSLLGPSVPQSAFFTIDINGNVTLGQWQGTAVAVAYGGTGATTAAGARTNLGLGSAATASSSDFAAASHSHAASAINSGTLDIARIPTGTSSATVCIGNDSRLSDARTPTSHNQAWSTITSTPTTRSGYGITDAQKTITSGTAAPTGGSDGDIYLQYT